MTTVLLAIATVLAVAVALALAFVPLMMAMRFISKRIAVFIERRRERRQASRETPDRRQMREEAAVIEPSLAPAAAPDPPA